MKTAWIDKQICYDGTQLRSHWIFKEAGVQGDAIVSFKGPADVPLKNMVDLADVRDNAPIFSRSMLHFIIEHFDGDLVLAVARGRLIVSIAAEELSKRASPGKIVRKGDDIYYEERKMSVSIATSSPVSTLIHFAINIESQGTPVPTLGLLDLKIDPRPFADEILRRYSEEIESMHAARCKVRSVS